MGQTFQRWIPIVLVLTLCAYLLVRIVRPHPNNHMILVNAKGIDICRPNLILFEGRDGVNWKQACGGIGASKDSLVVIDVNRAFFDGHILLFDCNGSLVQRVEFRPPARYGQCAVIPIGDNKEAKACFNRLGN